MYGAAVKANRLGKGLTIEVVASRTQLSMATISRIENDLQIPGVDTLQRLAAGLGVETSALMPSAKRVKAAAMAAAICMVAGVSESRLLVAFSPRVMEEAAEFKGMGLHEAARACLAEQGVRVGRRLDVDELRAAFASTDIAGILGNVADKVLIDAFENVETVTEFIAAPQNAANLREATFYTLTPSANFEEVSPDGEVKSGSIGSGNFAGTAKTHGVVWKVDRYSIINDDLQALLTMPKLIGRNAKIAREAAVVKALVDSGTFFSAGHANLATGGGSALSVTSLAAAETILRKQANAEGIPLLLRPAVLLTAPELKQTADTITAARALALNDPAKRIVPVASPFCNYAPFTGASATAWYLFAPPVDVAALAVIYLRGQDRPMIEQVTLPAGELGIGLRGVWDFGACTADYHAAVRSDGA